MLRVIQFNAKMSILLTDKHVTWDEYIVGIGFAMNSKPIESPNHSCAYVTFERVMRSPREPLYDFKRVVEAVTLGEAKVKLMNEQDRRKAQADNGRRPAERYQPSDRVWVRTAILSSTARGVSSKLAPKRDALFKVSPTSNEIL